MQETAGTLTRAEKGLLAALVLVYLAWKVYKVTLMERYGPFSLEFLGASVLAGVGIVVTGMLAFWILHWLQSKGVARRRQS